MGKLHRSGISALHEALNDSEKQDELHPSNIAELRKALDVSKKQAAQLTRERNIAIQSSKTALIQSMTIFLLPRAESKV